MRRFRLEVPGGWVELRDRVLVGGIRLSGALARKFRDIHFTVPLNATAHFRPHVKLIEHGGRVRREDLADLRFDEFLEHVAVLERDLVLHWRTGLTSVEPEALHDAGYLVFVPDEASLLALIRRNCQFALTERRLTVERPRPSWELDVFDYVLAHLRSPLDVPPEQAVGQPLGLLRFDEDGLIEAYWLMYLQRPIGVGESPGWYAIPFSGYSLEIVFRSIAHRHGVAVFEAIERIGALLGAEPSDQWTGLRAAAMT